MADANQSGMDEAKRAAYKSPEVLAALAAEVIFGSITDSTEGLTYSEISSSAAEVN